MRGSLDEMQDWAIGAIRDHARTHASGVFEAATGTGKTRTAAKLCQRWVPELGRPALFLANRIELIEQTYRSFTGLGLGCEIEMAALTAAPSLRPGSMLPRPDVVIASHLSLHPDRVTTFERDAFGLIIADECHAATVESWTHIFDYFRPDYRLGLSATPFRMDGRPVHGPGAPFEGLVARYTIAEAIADGNLAPVRAHTCGKDLDISAISTRGMDFDPESMEAFILENVDELCNAAVDQFEKLGSKKAIIFTPDIMSAKVAAKVLTKLGRPTLAVHGHSERHPMGPDRRRAILESFERGEIFGLANCELCTTGYDCPAIDAVVMMLATKSLPGFIQRVGRGTRKAEGKDHVDVIGYSWQGAEGVISTVDLFGVEYDDLEIRRRAHRKLQDRESTDPLAALEAAKAELEAERERERREREERERIEAEELARQERAKVARQARRTRVRRRRTDYLVQTYEPYREALARAAAGTGDAPTLGQTRFLKDRGIEAEGLDRVGAQACVDDILRREAWGLASPAQEAWLIRTGHATPDEARTWTAAAARAALQARIRACRAQTA